MDSEETTYLLVKPAEKSENEDPTKKITTKDMFDEFKANKVQSIQKQPDLVIKIAESGSTKGR